MFWRIDMVCPALLCVSKSRRRIRGNWRRCWTTARSSGCSGSSQLSVPNGPRAMPAEPCGWWRRRPSRTTGSARWTRDDPGSAARPRLQALAGEKCGACRSSMKSTSRRWRMFSKRTSDLTIPPNRWSVWTRSRSLCMRKCVPHRRRRRAGPGGETRRRIRAIRHG